MFSEAFDPSCWGTRRRPGAESRRKMLWYATSRQKCIDLLRNALIVPLWAIRGICARLTRVSALRSASLKQRARCLKQCGRPTPRTTPPSPAGSSSESGKCVKDKRVIDVERPATGAESRCGETDKPARRPQPHGRRSRGAHESRKAVSFGRRRGIAAVLDGRLPRPHTRGAALQRLLQPDHAGVELVVLPARSTFRRRFWDFSACISCARAVRRASWLCPSA